MPSRDPLPPPPRWLDRWLERLCAPHLLEEVLGDLHERYYLWAEKEGVDRARRRYGRDVLSYLRFSTIKRSFSAGISSTSIAMIKNYFIIGWRNLVNNKGYSLLNLGGLAMGMTVAILIGLWIYDELTFNQYHDNYDRIVQVLKHQTYEGERETDYSQVPGLGTLLGTTYERYFEHVVMATQAEEFVLATADNKKFTQIGSYLQADGPDLLTLRMIEGTRDGLDDMHSVLISATLADKLFTDTDPVGQSLILNASQEVKISGVYEDLPLSSTFNELDFILPLSLHFAADWTGPDVWNNHYMRIYAQLKPGVSLAEASEAVKDVILAHIDPEEAAKDRPEVFLHPMAKWHLHSQFENGAAVPSKAYTFVWFFGAIGIFVLLLACINFMNLSTARSEKRTKEIGIRKSFGSARRQLISQFLSESMLMVILASALSMVLVQVVLPWFNNLAGKEISALSFNPWQWGLLLPFIVLTGLLAGSYPALYLSSFQAVKVLKGTYRAGRKAALPRQVLVVFQFTISIALVIGTIMVYQQIQFVKDRPVGYAQEGLITLPMNSPEYYESYERLRNELIRTGAVENVAKSTRPLTSALGWNGGFSWPGKAPDADPGFNTIWVSPDYGATIGWDVVAGRDFSRAYTTDTAAIIINESALALMGLEDPVGEVVSFEPGWAERKEYTIVGVVKDLVKESPYEETYPSVIFNSPRARWLFVRINPQLRAREALPQIEQVFAELVPSAPFDYKFVDDEYNTKFQAEERIGQLAGLFAALAIVISGLGLLGLASYVAEQRTKEIGVRKVLGASVVQLWRLLSKDFVILVGLACLIAIPVAYYFLRGWLQNYQYRTDLVWWVFGAAGGGVLIVTLLTVSFQSVKAALANPIDSLRNE